MTPLVTYLLLTWAWCFNPTACEFLADGSSVCYPSLTLAWWLNLIASEFSIVICPLVASLWPATDAGRVFYPIAGEQSSDGFPSVLRVANVNLAVQSITRQLVSSSVTHYIYLPMTSR